MDLVNYQGQNAAENQENMLLTIDDLEAGAPVQYDALVLYADANQDFVDELVRRMQGFRLLTRYRDNLRLGYMPQELMCRLITSRCRYVILIYSNAFFESLDEPIDDEGGAVQGEARRQLEIRRQNRYYADYVHADKVASKACNMIPCVYEECDLPGAYRHNFMLYVHSAAYNFYDRLAKTLRSVPMPSFNNGLAATGLSRPSDAASRLSIVQTLTRRCRNLARRFYQNRHRILQEV